MTQTDIDRIKTYIEKATPGPWETMYNIGVDGTHLSGLQEECYVGCDINEFPDDMLFIANARTDLPLLVQQVEQLRRELAVKQQLIDKRVENAVAQGMEDIVKLQAEAIEQLRKEREELLKDKERLDWLETNHRECRWMPISKFWYLLLPGKKPFEAEQIHGDTMRDCIDAALHPTSKPA